MTFLEWMRRYLANAKAPDTAFVPDIAVHRAHLVRRLLEMEKAGRPEAEIRRAHNFWTPTVVGQFVQVMTRALQQDFGLNAAPAEIRAWINAALDQQLNLETSTGSKVHDWELERLTNTASSVNYISGREEYLAENYLHKIRAIKNVGDWYVMTAIGKLICELPDNDARRWMLAAEVVQSDGPEDEWRLSREGARFLIKNPKGTREYHDTPVQQPISDKLFSQLLERGIAGREDDLDADQSSYWLFPEGRALLEEVAANEETPFTLLVRALLQDETGTITHSARPAAVSIVRESSADATARHARMVAHEIRNALVPVQSAVESLYRDLDREGKSSIAEKRRSGIDGGIDRIFRFLQDISSIADLASTPSDLFDLTGPVNEAIVAITSDTGLTIPFDSPGALPAVKGHRDRFSLALVNVLRNAVQSRPREGLQIRVSAGTHNGAEVYVAVDDNGPGVPAEHRATIFEPGFSLRAQGSGQGLALVREVIEAEMAGRAVCEQSDLGGARIVLRLPVGSKRKL